MALLATRHTLNRPWSNAAKDGLCVNAVGSSWFGIAQLLHGGSKYQNQLLGPFRDKSTKAASSKVPISLRVVKNSARGLRTGGLTNIGFSIKLDPLLFTVFKRIL
jgi:hypothetical protein